MVFVVSYECQFVLRRRPAAKGFCIFRTIRPNGRLRKACALQQEANLVARGRMLLQRSATFPTTWWPGFSHATLSPDASTAGDRRAATTIARSMATALSHMAVT